MSDLTKELPVEKLSNESWVADRAARQARVASRVANTNQQKSLFCQMSWCNTNTDNLGNLLRFVKNIEVVATAEANKTHFNAATKKSLIEKLRAASISNNNNTAYLRLAKDFDYEVYNEYIASPVS